MPRVPNYQPGQVGSVQTTNARLRAADNSGGLGLLAEGLAGAARLASTVDKFELDNDEAQQRRVLAEARLAYTGKGEDFSTLRLSDARDGEKDAVRDLDKIKDGFLQQARSPRARQMISEGLMQIDGETRLRLTQHATTEARAEQKASFGFEQSAIVDNAVTIGLENPAAKDRLGLQLRDSVRNQLAFEGFDEKASPQIYAQAEKAAVSKMHQGIVDRMFSDRDPRTDEIIAYRAAYQDEMTPDLSNDIMRRLQGPLQDRLATSDTAAILSIYQGDSPEKAANVGSTSGYMDRIGYHESRSSDTAKNPRSSATGRYQFTDGTWLASYKKRYGSSGLSDSQILAKRSDRATQDVLMQDFTNDNTKALRDAGLPVDGGTLYLAHFAGAVGAKKVLTADPEASVASVLGPKVMASNPFLKNWTAGALINWAGGVGGKEGVPNAPVERDPVKLNQAIDQWARATGASPERAQRARLALQAHVRTDESMLKARQQDADEQARVIALNAGDNFRVPMLPKAVRDNLSPVDLAEYGAAERRLNEARAKGNAEAKSESKEWELEAQMRFDPEGFKRVDLKKLMGVVAPDALNTLAVKQVEMIRKPPPKFQPQEAISSAISRGKRFFGVDVPDKDLPTVYDFMKDRLTAIQQKNGGIGPNDADEAFKAATSIAIRRPGSFWSGDTTRRGYEVTVADIADGTKDMIRRNWKGSTPPSDDQILDVYRAMVPAKGL